MTQNEWIEKLMKTAERDLAGEPLSAEDLRLLEQMDALDAALPGAVADAFLSHAFGASEDTALEIDEEDQVAAETVNSLAEPVSDFVRAALNKGETVVRLMLAGKNEAVLSIDASTLQVTACFVPGWEFAIERGHELEQVTEFGGCYRRFEDLDTLYFHIDESHKALRIGSFIPESSHAETR